MYINFQFIINAVVQHVHIFVQLLVPSWEKSTLGRKILVIEPKLHLSNYVSLSAILRINTIMTLIHLANSIYVRYIFSVFGAKKSKIGKYVY